MARAGRIRTRTQFTRHDSATRRRLQISTTSLCDAQEKETSRQLHAEVAQFLEIDRAKPWRVRLIIMRDQRPAVQARDGIWMQMRLWVWEMRSWRLDRGIRKGDGMRHRLEEQQCRLGSLEFVIL
jgi:hypothetical protein